MKSCKVLLVKQTESFGSIPIPGGGLAVKSKDYHYNAVRYFPVQSYLNFFYAGSYPYGLHL